MNIIFVCTGNTCRSPMAEGILKSQNIPFLSVSSRGLFADGSLVSENSVEVMREIGIDISSHVSKQITKNDIDSADKIICLSPSHFSGLSASGVDKSKLFVLGNGISDPYGCGIDIYRKCRDEISKEINFLIKAGFFNETAKSFKIVPIDQRHIAAISKLEQACFSEPWSAEGILESYRCGTKFFVAENENHVMGYIGINTVLDEGYITNVAVFEKYRRIGVGTALLEQVFKIAGELSLSFVSLEVRASNQNAISLYKNKGFENVGERRNFYRNPTENAIIMTRRFDNTNENTGN